MPLPSALSPSPMRFYRWRRARMCQAPGRPNPLPGFTTHPRLRRRFTLTQPSSSVRRHSLSLSLSLSLPLSHTHQKKKKIERKSSVTWRATGLNMREPECGISPLLYSSSFLLPSPPMWESRSRSRRRQQQQQALAFSTEIPETIINLLPSLPQKAQWAGARDEADRSLCSDTIHQINQTLSLPEHRPHQLVPQMHLTPVRVS